MFCIILPGIRHFFGFIFTDGLMTNTSLDFLNTNDVKHLISMIFKLQQNVKKKTLNISI